MARECNEGVTMINVEQDNRLAVSAAFLGRETFCVDYYTISRDIWAKLPNTNTLVFRNLPGLTLDENEIALTKRLVYYCDLIVLCLAKYNSVRMLKDAKIMHSVLTQVAYPIDWDSNELPVVARSSQIESRTVSVVYVHGPSPVLRNQRTYVLHSNDLGGQKACYNLRRSFITDHKQVLVSEELIERVVSPLTKVKTYNLPQGHGKLPRRRQPRVFHRRECLLRPLEPRSRHVHREGVLQGGIPTDWGNPSTKASSIITTIPRNLLDQVSGSSGNVFWTLSKLFITVQHDLGHVLVERQQHAHPRGALV